LIKEIRELARGTIELSEKMEKELSRIEDFGYRKLKKDEKSIKSDMNKEKIVIMRKIKEKLSESNYHIKQSIEKLFDENPYCYDGDEEEYQEFMRNQEDKEEEYKDMISNAKKLIEDAKLLFAKHESDFPTEFRDNANKVIEKLEDICTDEVESYSFRGDSYLEYEEDIKETVDVAQEEIKERLDKMHKQINEIV